MSHCFVYDLSFFPMISSFIINGLSTFHLADKNIYYLNYEPTVYYRSSYNCHIICNYWISSTESFLYVDFQSTFRRIHVVTTWLYSSNISVFIQTCTRSWYPLTLMLSVSIICVVMSWGNGGGEGTEAGDGAGDLNGVGLRSRNRGSRSSLEVTFSSRSIKASSSEAGLW